jgi:SH3-like domain-containing protein
MTMADWARRTSVSLLRALVLIPSLAACSFASAQAVGPASNLPIPRYVSLKADKVNMRNGPARDHEVTWVFTRLGLPVEITAESENWRKIRDSEGTEGWVYQSLLSSRRTALVTPWSKKDESFPLYRSNDRSADIIAQLQPGVLATIKTCDGKWCRIFGEGFDGFIEQERLWGVYPNEIVE